MQNLHDKLRENLQLIYRKAIDADAALGKLHQQGKGKFQHIFGDDSGFNTRSKRFGPYVEELGLQIAALETMDEAGMKTALPDVIKKLEQLFSTLAQFQQSIKD